MARTDYLFYDTALLGTTAGTAHVLFQQGQSSVSGKEPSITNMRGNGSFPDRTNFTIHKFGVHIDDTFTEDDVLTLFHSSIFKFEYNDNKIYEIPLHLLSDKNMVGGILGQATASDFIYAGQEGDGYNLTMPFEILGGTSFSITITQGKALSANNLDLKVYMNGIIDTGN